MRAIGPRLPNVAGPWKALSPLTASGRRGSQYHTVLRHEFYLALPLLCHRPSQQLHLCGSGGDLGVARTPAVAGAMSASGAEPVPPSVVELEVDQCDTD